MLLDLDKLRSSAKYKTYFDERKVNALVKNYIYHSSGEIPTLGDMVNLIAADSENLVKINKIIFPLLVFLQKCYTYIDANLVIQVARYMRKGV